MCGRFISITNANKISKIFNVSKIKNFSKESYNVCPQQNINVLFYDNEDLIFDSFSWGYTYYNKLNNKNQLVINSRLETINTKLLFKDSYLKRKCLIIANGYIEWKIENREKIPYFINIPEKETLFFGAIWRQEKRLNNYVPVCCIITKKASDKIKYIHERMPFIFSANEALSYLHDKDNKLCNPLFESEIDNELDYYKISKKINNPINNDKDYLNPLK